MTGVILVVDDVPANVKLLEAKLTNEYYDVVTAKDGYEALEKTKAHKPDLILLDVMMPGMDGFETCRKIKEDPDIAHIPIVMVTALSETSDRVQGLEAGADDFITKPINDTALFARVKSLVRIKVLIDELRLRDQSGAQMGIINDIVSGIIDVDGAHIIVIDDDAVQSRRMKDTLSGLFTVDLFSTHLPALEHAKTHPVDLIMISTMLGDIDGLRLATQFKAIDTLRHVPVIMLVDEDDQHLMLKALDLGVNDYLVVPVDQNEMMARVKTQLRRKKYQDTLKSNYKESVSMAITDGLTQLYNRHYLDTHLKNLTESSLANHKNMSLIIMDMDHFKSVNDNYGHDVGDEVLRQLSKIIIDSTRSADLAARYGGEEFVILMPETDFTNAFEVADRIRRKVENTPFIVSHSIGTLSKTVSIGVSSITPTDTAETLLKRADTALYTAKNSGRNQVFPKQNPTESASGGGQPPVQSIAQPAPAVQPAVLPLHSAGDVSAATPQQDMVPATPYASAVAPQPVTPQPIELQPVAPQLVQLQPLAPQPVQPEPVYAPVAANPEPVRPLTANSPIQSAQRPVLQPVQTVYQPAVQVQQNPEALQPVMPTASLYEPMSPPAPQQAPAEAPQFAPYNPHLANVPMQKSNSFGPLTAHQESASVEQSDETSSYELVVKRAASGSASGGQKSPIDDEPPGTF